jgi:glyoxylase I family protein
VVGDDERPVLRIHHAALCPHDLEESLRFYCEGVGMEVLSDFASRGDWKTLFEIDTQRLRSVMLGHPERQEAGILELVVWDDVQLKPRAPWAPGTAGFLLLSFFTEIDRTSRRLRYLGYEPKFTSIDTPALHMRLATVRDPDGVLVELVELVEGELPGFGADR